jgi:hypothetical protein
VAKRQAGAGEREERHDQADVGMGGATLMRSSACACAGPILAMAPGSLVQDWTVEAVGEEGIAGQFYCVWLLG